MKKLLAAIEMAGTLNALKRPFSILQGQGWEIRYAATEVAADILHASEIPFFPASVVPTRVIHETKPGLVVIGDASGTPTSGVFEAAYGLAALDAGVPVVCYRDYSGLNPLVADPLSAHKRSSDLLNFFMFEEATVRTIKERGYASAKAVAVGSGYYDEDGARNWPEARRTARAALGLSDADFFVVMISGSGVPRVLETLEPVVEGLKRRGNGVFAPFFHMKDPDAPYERYLGKKGQWLPTAGGHYNEALDRLADSGVRLFREPEARNVLHDPKLRVAAADWIIMNPLSSDTWTAVYARVPFLITAPPLTIEEAEKDGIKIFDLDFVTHGACDIETKPDGIRDYAAKRIGDEAIAARIRRAEERFTPKVASDEIARRLMRTAATAS